MEHIELVLLALLVLVPALALIGQVTHVPYPITLVIGGSLIALIPGLPEVELDPDTVLVVFLPPLLYGAAFFTSLRDLKRNVREIALLSIGVVFATMGAVAVVAHEVVGLGWAESFVLGAIVSPTDAVAPAEIMRRVGAPRRLVVIVEGENLTNDWTALVLYKTAVAAVVTGAFSLPEASAKLVLSGLGGLAIGLAAGYVIREIRRRVNDPPIEIAISILSGYAAYLPAEELGVSGVIAAVTVGIYMGWHTPQLTTAVMRIQGVAVWEIITFLLNVVLFLLIGLQLPQIVEALGDRPAGQLLGWGALLSAVVVGVRLAWVFTVRGPMQHGWRERLVIGWAGMRGGVSLAAALALPLTIDAGGAFPERDLIIFLGYAVLLVTLVGQGLTLGPLIDRLGICDDGQDEREEIDARVRTAESALARLEEVEGEDWVLDDTAERVRGMYGYRRRRFNAQAAGDGDEQYEERTGAYQRLMYELFDAQRETLIELRNSGAISDEVRRRLERELDLEESRLDG